MPYGTRFQGGLGGEFFGGAMGGSPRAQQQFLQDYPGLHPENWAQSGAGYGPGGGIPGNAGFQFLTGGSASYNPSTGSMSKSVSGVPMSAYGPGGAMGGPPRGGMLGFGGGMGGGMGGYGMSGMGGWGIHGPGGGGMDTTWGSGPGFPVGEGGGYSGSGSPGGFNPPDFNLPGMPNVEWNQMPRRIQIGDTVVDFGDPSQLQAAMLGYYGQRGAQLAQVYGQQLQYMQNLRLGQMQQQTAMMEAKNRAAMQREGIEMQHGNRMGAFESIMGAFGGGGTMSIGDFPGMSAGDYAADTNAALGENAAEAGGSLYAARNAMGGPGGGMAGNASLGPLGAHSRMMADVGDVNELRRQRMQNRLGMMQGIGGILGAI